MASLNYLSALHDILRGNIDLDTDSFKGMLVTSAYVPDKTGHLKRNQVTNESSGTGYSAGGFPVTVTVAKDTANNRCSLTFSSTPLSGATVTARGMVIYKNRGGASSADELLCYLDFGGDISSTAGTFTPNYATPLYVNNS